MIRLLGAVARGLLNGATMSSHDSDRDNPLHSLVIHAEAGSFGGHAPGCPRCEQLAQDQDDDEWRERKDSRND